MPVLKKYSGIKTCEDAVQRLDLNTNDAYLLGRPFQTAAGATKRYIYWKTNGTTNTNLHYLAANTIKASEDTYDPDDYNGTSTGTCTFSLSKQTSGLIYQIQFTADESATVRCFKFFKNIQCGDDSTGGNTQNTLMFAIYLDTPMTVQAGDVKVMSVTFAYDDVEVEII